MTQSKYDDNRAKNEEFERLNYIVSQMSKFKQMASKKGYWITMTVESENGNERHSLNLNANDVLERIAPIIDDEILNSKLKIEKL